MAVAKHACRGETSSSGPAVAVARTQYRNAPRPRRRASRRRSRRAGRGCPGRGVGAASLEPVEPGVQLDEDEASRVGRLARGGEHSDPLDEVAVAGVGDDGEGAVEHVLVGGARLEAVTHRREELGDARGEHRLDGGK